MGTGSAILLSSLGILPENAVVSHLASFAGLPVLEESQLPLKALLKSRVSPRYLARKSMLPVAETADRITLAVSDPFDSQALHALGLALRKDFDLVLAEPSLVNRAIAGLYSAGDVQPSSLHDTGNDEPDGDVERLKDLASEAPVIRFVNDLIARAFDSRASDIHLEPFKGELNVRFRIDGMLRPVPPPSKEMRPAIISRIKLLAKLDISERRLPQDGRIKIAVRGRDFDLRISIYPTMYGESAVIRLLDKATANASLAQLGMPPQVLEAYHSQLSNPSGVTLVTGPTGSGKTTTLYATLQEIVRPETKIFTIEDPIEYELPGVNQSQVKPRIGLTFATSLRSMLRQDPDVILVGEIRDAETAEICAQAALTGHRVFSTVHTNDSTSAITRLIDLGLPAYLLVATIDSVIGQRLVRRLCSSCKNDPNAGRNNCAKCQGTGYSGRVGVYEVLVLNDRMRRAIRDGMDAVALRELALSSGMRTMYEDGLVKISQGLTTIDELQRVVKRA